LGSPEANFWGTSSPSTASKQILTRSQPLLKWVKVRNVKDVQRLMGCLTTLSHFVSRLEECELTLYKLLKKSDSFRWTDEMQKALDDLKAIISKPPILASPEPGETLLLYVVATTLVISTTLVVEREEPEHIYKVQRPVYYISKVLSDYETRYN
jgi:hypothetical protein